MVHLACMDEVFRADRLLHSLEPRRPPWHIVELIVDWRHVLVSVKGDEIESVTFCNSFDALNV